MKKAWIENERIRDIAPGNPEELYHPDIAAYYSENVPDDAANGDGWDGVTLTKLEPPAPVAPEPMMPVPPKISPVEFKLLFTAQERVAIKTSTDDIVQDFFELVNDPRLLIVDLGLQSTKDTLTYLVSKSLITQGRKDQILLGQVV